MNIDDKVIKAAIEHANVICDVDREAVLRARSALAYGASTKWEHAVVAYIKNTITMSMLTDADTWITRAEALKIDNVYCIPPDVQHVIDGLVTALRNNRTPSTDADNVAPKPTRLSDEELARKAAAYANTVHHFKSGPSDVDRVLRALDESSPMLRSWKMAAVNYFRTRRAMGR